MVRIVRLVAIRALHLRFIEHRRLVATFASDRDMEADQRVFCHIVVKFDVVPPSHFIVAIVTIFAECRLVNVLLDVAINAGHRKFHGEVAVVTILAICRRMGAAQGKPRILGVVKFCVFPTRNGMASFAF